MLYLREDELKVKSLFSPLEMRRRLNQLRSKMTQLDLDTVVVSSTAVIKYYSDVQISRFFYPCFLVVDHIGSYLVIADADANISLRRCFGETVQYNHSKVNGHITTLSMLLNGQSNIGIEPKHISINDSDAFTLKQASLTT